MCLITVFIHCFFKTDVYHQSSSHKCNHSAAKSTHTNADSSTQKSRIQLCFAADYASYPKAKQFAVFLPMSSSIIDIITQLNRFLHLGKYWHQRLCTSLSSCSKSWMSSGIMDLYNTFLEVSNSFSFFILHCDVLNIIYLWFNERTRAVAMILCRGSKITEKKTGDLVWMLAIE